VDLQWVDIVLPAAVVAKEGILNLIVIVVVKVYHVKQGNYQTWTLRHD